MKRWLAAFFAGLLLLLSSCSFLNSAYDTLDYVKDAKNYLEKVSQFSNEIPPLITQAAESQTAANDLKTKLLQMKKEIESFNSLKVPETAAEFHQQIIQQNALLADQIDIYLKNIMDGKLDPSLLEEANELLQPIKEIKSIVEQLQKLGAQVQETLGSKRSA
ncbi:DUF6376 family protein [Neobacillus sp. SAB-20_R2A]|uniref:DUF6376 family protein n=1 Tax=Neobacillus sp. SAB-20_R2A TaxID=3120519 RepID=UPI003C6E7BC5